LCDIYNISKVSLGMVATTESGEEALYEAARRAIAFEFMTLTEWAKWTAYQKQEN